MENPLHFFEQVLSKNYTQLKQQYLSDTIENLGQQITNVDTEKGIVTYWTAFSDGSSLEPVIKETAYSFTKHFAQQIRSQSSLALKEIKQSILNISIQGNSPQYYLEAISENLLQLIEIAKSNYRDFPILHESLYKIYIGINPIVSSNELTASSIPRLSSKSCDETESKPIPIATAVATSVHPINYSKFSFQWDLNLEESEEQLGKLYELLIENPALIEADKQEFINAFTQREVIAGVNWLVLSKSKICSKSSLFYFLQQLIDQSGLIDEPDDFNKKVEYVFRDNLGQKLSNIKQSKSQASDNPAQKERIDLIIEELLNIE